MSNYQQINALIKPFSGQHNTIGCPRIYCKFMGSLEGGVFLSQVIYFSDKGGRRDGWFYKTYDEWKEELELSEYKVRKLSRQLEDLGVLETKVKKANGAPTVHYRFDTEKFKDLILKFLGMETEKTSESLTETTTETTTKEDIHISPLPGMEEDLSPPQPKPEKAYDGRAWFVALAELCAINLKLATTTQKRQLGQSAKLLKKSGVTPEQIDAFGEWWYTEDWRGKQGNPPRPAQVREVWGQFERSGYYQTAEGPVLAPVALEEL